MLKSATAMPYASLSTLNGPLGVAGNVWLSFWTQSSKLAGEVQFAATMSSWPSPVKSPSATAPFCPTDGSWTGALKPVLAALRSA